MRRYAGVLLDVDGTLLDSNDIHAHAWVEALAEHGIEVAFERVRRMIGMGGDRLIELVAGFSKDSRESKRISKHRSEIFQNTWLSQVRPLVGARELLQRLRAEGYPYAIATAAKEQELAMLLEAGGIADLCDLRTTSSDVEESKPDPEVVMAALAKLSVERSRAVMIGDTPYDVEAARGANVEIIGFTSGGWSTEALAGAVAMFAGPADLLARWAQSPLAD